jgi:SPP1 gp7 family putative phage head morphogenesis protein
MKNSEYWARRFEILEDAAVKKGEAYYATLEKEYREASRRIESEISMWYQRFSTNNEITLSEARRLLNSSELKEFKWTVQDYIKFGEENALNQQWMKQLENASAKVHISRLEALKVQMQQQMEVLYGNQTDGIDALARRIYSDSYYHTAYEIQKGFNVGWDLQGLNEKQLERVLSKPWTADMQTFRDKCWTQKQSLVATVQTELTQAIMRGDSPDRAIKTISEKFRVAKSKAGRLVMTESAYFSSEAQKNCFNELDVEKYEIVATLDRKTSKICQDLDGQVFEMKDYQPGVTAPPFHPWCRTTTVPYFEDNLGERAARGDDGKEYYVPSNMKYADWKKSFVDGGSKSKLKEVTGNDIIDNPLFPAELGGVKRGNPMTRDDADGGKPNPNFNKGGGYRTNCQSCVVGYEARLRGYNVQTLPNTKGSRLDILSRKTNLAWFDPTTGKHPEYIFDDAARTVKKFADFLEQTVKAQNRYTLEFSWKGRRRSGHIISLDRDSTGGLRLYDPQTGETYTGDEVKKYLGRIKYETTVYGTKLPARPKVLRIDDKQFNLDVVNDILEGVKE